MVVRTRVIDDLITASISEGCDRVVNLAAGLDTRPYRMALPSSLDWVEADLGPMIDEKEKLLAGETPRCTLRRERIDLANWETRLAFLLRATSGAKKVLVLTEGLLIYLDDCVVESIGRDLLTQPAIQWWVLDVNSPAVRQMLQKGMSSLLENAPMKFAPRDGVAFFEKLGWKARDIHPFFREALRLRRLPLFLRMFALFPERDPRAPANARWSGIVRFELYDVVRGPLFILAWILFAAGFASAAGAAPSTARTCSTWPSTFTEGNASRMVLSGPTMKVLRIVPSTFLPYIVFSP